MAGSLLDFGEIAQRAQQQVRDAISMQNLGLHQQQLGLQERQTKVNEQQLAVNQQSEQTSRLNSIRQIWQDPRVQHDPELSDQLFGAIAPMVGIPTEGLQDKLTQSHRDRHELMTATLGGDPQKAQSAIIKLMSGMEPDKAAVFLKNIESVPALHARAQIAKQTLEINEAKFGELRQNQAIVNEGRGPLTALSSILRDQTSVFNSPEYKKAQSIHKTLGKSSILDPADKTLSEKEKGPLKNLMKGNAEQLAENLEPEIMRWQHQLDTANRALIDMDHGITQPGQMKEQLTARIATAGPILGALRDMQAAYRDPLNSEKAELAKHAYKTIEARRVELEAMDKKLDAQRMGLVNLANEKFDYKQGQDNAIALGQQEYFALPEKQRNGQAAAKIAAKVTADTGIPVKVSDIVKDPNAPTSSVTVNNAMARGLGTKAAERIDKGANVAEQAVKKITTVNRMLDAIEKDNVNLGPGATVQQYIGQLSTKLGIGGKTTDERIQNTRTIIQGLAETVLNNREQLEGQGSISNYESQIAERASTPGEIEQFTVPELKALLELADRSARFEHGLHENRMKILRDDPDESIRREARLFEAPPLPKSRFEGKAAPPQPGKAQPQWGASGYGNRPDGTPKGAGYFGEIPSPVRPGEFSTELTIGVNLGGKETDIPLITPNLSRSEIEMVMRGKESKEIINKAVEHAKARMKQGKSPYAGDSERRELPAWKPKEFESFYNSLGSGDSYIGPDGKRRTKR